MMMVADEWTRTGVIIDVLYIRYPACKVMYLADTFVQAMIDDPDYLSNGVWSDVHVGWYPLRRCLYLQRLPPKRPGWQPTSGVLAVELGSSYNSF